MLPKIRATRFRLKKPISPQLTAPIIVMVRAKYCKKFIIHKSPSFHADSIPKKQKNIRSIFGCEYLKKLFDFQYLRDNGSSAEAECLTCLEALRRIRPEE